MRTLPRSLFLLPLFLFLFFSCNKESGPLEPPTTGSSGTIVTGEFAEVARQMIPGSGGKLSVNTPGSPLDGFELTLPLDGLAQTQEFVVSYAEVTSHNFGPNFNPVSPLITISYDGGYSGSPMTLTIPIDLPDGHFAMGFFYDELTGSLEPIPVRTLDSTSITLSTRHLAPSNATQGRSLLGKPQGVRGMLLISSIRETILDGQPTLSSGFTPGVDDWEFINSGSYIAPGGHCAGQAISAMWYYYEKRLTGESPLYGRFDTVNDPARPDALWQDNPRGYRFASTIHVDHTWGDYETNNVDYYANRPRSTWYSFIYAMLLTSQPQYIYIHSTAAKTAHAMIVYKVTPSTGSLYIADPNYPGNRDPWSGTPSTRIIEYENGKFKPYPAGLVAGGPESSYDEIAFAGRTAYVDWSTLTERWAEFENGTIGNDRFPAYRLWVREGQGFVLKDTLTTSADTLELHSRSLAAGGWIPNTDHLQEFWVCDEDGNYVGEGDENNGGVFRLLIPPDLESRFGFYIMGETATGQKEYVDFRWVDIKRPRSDVDFSRVKKISFGATSIITHWKLNNGDPWTTGMTIGFLSEVTRSGNTFTGVQEITEDTVRVTVGPSSIQVEGGNGNERLGSLGYAYFAMAGTFTSSPVSNAYGFSYSEDGPLACSAITKLILDTYQSSTFEGFSCDDNTVFSVQFYY